MGIVSTFATYRKCSLIMLLMLVVVVIYFAHSGSVIKNGGLYIQRRVQRYQDGTQKAAAVDTLRPKYQAGTQNVIAMDTGTLRPRDQVGTQRTEPMNTLRPKDQVGTQNAVALNIWRPRDHQRKQFTSASLIVPPAAIAAKAVKKDKIKIYLYPPPEMISDAVRKGGWEQGYIVSLTNYFMKNPDLNLIDIGTMIGIYTLQVANLGRKVVGVDGNAENLWRLGQSLVDNQLEKQVTLVHNLMDAKHTLKQLKILPGHVGGSYVDQGKKDWPAGKNQAPLSTITGDDLLSVITFKRAVLKMDIENHEYEMLQCASKLFEKVDIPLVMMEFNPFRRSRKQGNYIKNFMTSRDLFPYANIDSNVILGPDHSKWPFDVVWRKNHSLSEYRP